MNIIHVVGARPNFMKMAPLKKRMDMYPREFKQTVVHTGQHYDENMSKVFFSNLSLPNPDINLGVGSGSHAWQVANVMMKFETLIEDLRPDVVFVVGDVNATIACALVCSKLGVKVAHVEAGLRSGDRTMPEEVNRLLTDQISDFLFTPSKDGDANLLREGVDPEKIYFVGNIMIDSLMQYREAASVRAKELMDEYHLSRYGLITLHRPANVDDIEHLSKLVHGLRALSLRTPLVFPVHPRTRSRLEEAGLMDELNAGNIFLLGPQGYIDFLALQSRAEFILTDSGGVQEESSLLGVPCITLRDNTERPTTISNGTNVLVGRRVDGLVETVECALNTVANRHYELPSLWDGRTAERIVDIMRGVGGFFVCAE